MAVGRTSIWAVTMAVSLAANTWTGGMSGTAWGETKVTNMDKKYQDGVIAAKRMVADMLTDDAWVRARSLTTESKLGARESVVLLRLAQQLNPQDPVMLRLLGLAAATTNQNTLAADAMKTLARLDPENLVVQVDFLDMLVQGKSVDEQIKLYKSALAKTSFDVQVRSEIASRIGRLYMQRGENDEAAKYFGQSLKLNDANSPAIKSICALQAKTNVAPEERLKTLIQLLMVNPYDPDALLTGARMLESGNAHKSAANWLVATMEQYQAQGVPTPPEIMLELACELICAERYKEAEAVLAQIAKIEDGPAIIKMLSYTLAQAQAVATTTAPATAPAKEAAPSLDDLVLEMRKRSAATLNKDPKNSSALAESVWVDYFYAATPEGDAKSRFDTLKSIVGIKDPSYARLEGWRLLQAGQVSEAKEIFSKNSDDPFAQLGLARIAKKNNDLEGLKQALCTAWEHHPAGLAAVLIRVEALREKVTLPTTAKNKALEEIAETYPERMLGMHRNPRDMLLVQLKGLKPNYNTGDPINLNVNILNTTDHPIYAGPGGAAGLSIGLAGSILGVNATPLGIFAIDNFPRVYRLERKSSITIPVRVDQGLLRDLFMLNLTRQFSISLMVTTNPRVEANGIVPGLGGQKVVANFPFDRTGLSVGGRPQILKMCSDIANTPLDKQMLIAAMMQSVAYNIPEDHTTDTGSGAGSSSPPAAKPGDSMASTRQVIIDTLVKLAGQGDPMVQSWMLRYAPNRELPAELAKVMDNLINSPDPVVRTLWYTHQLASAGKDPVERAKMAPLFKARAQAETDPLVKQWAELLAEEAVMQMADPKDRK